LNFWVSYEKINPKIQNYLSDYFFESLGFILENLNPKIQNYLSDYFFESLGFLRKLKPKLSKLFI